MAVKRFQRIGVVQPDSIVEQSSEPSPVAVVESRFQLAGRINPAIAIEPSSREFDATLPGASLLVNRANVQPATTTDTPSRQDGVTGRDIQSSTSQPWGGKSIGANPAPKSVTSTVRKDGPDVIHRTGGFATFPQLLLSNIITTVVRGYPGIATSRWGGMVIAPLYWLDTEPAFEAPTGMNKWAATVQDNGTKWSKRQTYAQRFTLSVDGGLEWPTIIPYS